MDTESSTSEVNEPDRSWLKRALASAAVDGKPRLFAIHGTYRSAPDEPILGWGMEFTGGDGALYRNVGHSAVHSSDSAERVLLTQSIAGDVELTWLDG